MKIFLILTIIGMLIFASGQLLPQSFAVSDTWAQQDTSTSEHLYDVHFADDSNYGWAVGSSGIILATTYVGEK